ncbi:MAG: hypothetical protein AB7F75_02240 [Planctomycetota bacterium]
MNPHPPRRQGQAALEYVILVGVLATALLASGASEALLGAVGTYFSEGATLMNLPIP